MNRGRTKKIYMLTKSKKLALYKKQLKNHQFFLFIDDPRDADLVLVPVENGRLSDFQKQWLDKYPKDREVKSMDADEILRMKPEDLNKELEEYSREQERRDLRRQRQKDNDLDYGLE